MNKLTVNLFLFISVSFFLSVYLIKSLEVKTVKAATATHVVISEIQAAGATSGEDFIELYNPTNLEVSLSDLRLVKRTSTGATNDSIVAFAADDSIASHGYFLWCNTSLNVALTCNSSTAGTVSNNNSVALSTDPLDSGTLIDTVTFGSPTNPLGEGTFLTLPAAGTSVERKNDSTSDATSLGVGGEDEFMGNGEDTDNNASDFVNRAIPQPQNSTSLAEPTVASPVPSASVEPSVVPSASVAPSTTPSTAPSHSAIPSISPSPVASPSAIPSISPSPVASPSIVPSSTPSPSNSPSATPFSRLIGSFPFAKNPKVCYLIYQPVKIGSLNLFLPKLSCQSL